MPGVQNNPRVDAGAIPVRSICQLIPKGGRVSFLLSLLGQDQKTTQEDEIKLLIDSGVIAQWKKRERVHIKQKACDDGSIPSHPTLGEIQSLTQIY